MYSVWNIGIKGMAWRLIDNLYKNVQAKVKFGNISTDFFEIDEGVKQGCVLSPILFCIYIHQFNKLLKGGYADHILIISKIIKIFFKYLINY